MPPYARNAHMIDRSQVLRAVQQDIENSDLSEQNKRYLLRLIRVDPDYFYEFIDDTIESHRKAPPPQPSAAPPSAPQPSAAAPAEASSPAVEKAKARGGQYRLFQGDRSPSPFFFGSTEHTGRLAAGGLSPGGLALD
jgi:hypothetical protein